MSNKQKNILKTSAEHHQKSIVVIIESLGRVHGINQVWRDWVEMCAIALARLDTTMFETREIQYLAIIKKYNKNELEALNTAFVHLVCAFEEHSLNGSMTDMLGFIYMTLDMGNEQIGQFFTHFNISLLMAQMGINGKTGEIISKRGFIELSEPACGAGGMILAHASVLQDAGYNHQQQLHVIGIDIDRHCVHMTFVQMALLHIPGIVVHGNALSGEYWEQWYTPAHILGNWTKKLTKNQSAKQTKSDNDFDQTENINEDLISAVSERDILCPNFSDPKHNEQLMLF